MGEALRDRVAVVAGASSGIGAAAKMLSGEGAKVTLAAKREEALRGYGPGSKPARGARSTPPTRRTGDRWERW